MIRATKLLEKMRANPRDDWTIEDILKVAESVEGIRHRRHRGSHHHFGYPAVTEICTVVERKPIKPIYIRKFVTFMDEVSKAREQRDE